MSTEVMKRTQSRIGRMMIILAMAVSLMIASLPGWQPVFAGGNIDWGKAVPITQNGQVVDSITVNGKTVQSIYAPRGNVANYDSDTTYCCAAFVKKFYRTVYGVDVWNLCPGNQPIAGSGHFYKTDSPRTGDIAASSGHWAIVRSVSGSAVSIIEQNCWNSGHDSAMVGRTLYDGSGYWYWRWSGADNGSNASSSKSLNIRYEVPPVEISPHNAVIHTTYYNPDRIHVKTIGCYLYDANGKLIKRHTESCSRPESKFYVWYDINAELGVTLNSNTTYKYKIFILHDGIEYRTSMQTFTTN